VCCHCFIAFHQWQILLWFTFTFRVLSRLALYFHKMICSLSATVQASSIVWGKHHLETVQTVGLETVHCFNLDTVQCSLLSRHMIIWSKWGSWNFYECFLDRQTILFNIWKNQISGGGERPQGLRVILPLETQSNCSEESQVELLRRRPTVYKFHIL